MMIEVRSFEGSAEELSHFIVTTWKNSYAGKMSVPDWNAKYLEWQLRLDDVDSFQHLIAAYIGSRLVGVTLHIPLDFEIHGQAYRASQASWLSVDPEFRGKGVAKALRQGALDVHARNNLAFELGYVYRGSKSSLGPKFWLSKRPDANNSRMVAGQAGFWVRVIDPLRAANWNTNRWESNLTRWTAPLVLKPTFSHRSDIKIRPFEPADLPRCVELARLSTQHCDLRLVWTEDQLRRQLTGFGKCLVVEQNGVVQGCVGYHILPIWGCTYEPVGIIDLAFLSELRYDAQVSLMDAVVCAMRDEGAVIALKLRTGDYPLRAFLRYGWVWKPAESTILMTWTAPPAILKKFGAKHLLWR